jgi:hypothetical protein
LIAKNKLNAFSKYLQKFDLEQFLPVIFPDHELFQSSKNSAASDVTPSESSLSKSEEEIKQEPLQNGEDEKTTVDGVDDNKLQSNNEISNSQEQRMETEEKIGHSETPNTEQQ